ncbi:hypothetical protein Tco_1451460 [Tanacetum coccineum]
MTNFSQGLRNANHTQTLDLVDIYGRFVYEDNLIQRRISKKILMMKLMKGLQNPSTSQNPKTFQPKNKGLVAETFDWDEEEVSDDEEVTQVKVLMALTDDELTVGKNHARNGEWVDITMRKEAKYAGLKKAEYASLNQAKYDRLIPSKICIQVEYDKCQAKYDRLIPSEI